MTIPVLRTKIILPHRREEILSRQRINNLVDELLDNKLIVVTAPAGYGKTSLLIDVSHQHEMPFCWFTLDPIDQDLQRFLAHFLASIEQRFVGFGEQSRTLLQAMGERQVALDEIVTVIVNEIYHSIQEHFAIVLDDYHLVNPSQAVNDFINRFVQDVDQNCHLITLSRSLSPFPDLPLMVAHSQVGGIGLHELAFRPDEVQALMMQNYHQGISDAVAAELTQKTEGWITGLLLSAQTMWQGMVDQLRLSRVSGIRLYDYLVHQVLDQQLPELRDFLLRTSYLDEFNTELCAALLGPPPSGRTWQGIVNEIVSHNLFVLPIGEGGAWLRYHHLFQDFLQNQLTVERPGEVTTLLRKLIEIYIEREEWEKAFSICQRLDDNETTADLLEQAGETMIVSGRIKLLERWLETLPDDVMNRRPALLSRQGIVLAMQGKTTQGLHLLNRSVEQFQSLQITQRLIGTLVWRALTHLIRSDYLSSLADATEVLSLTHQAGKDEELTRFRAEAYRICGESHRIIGKLDEAIDELTQSLRLFQARSDVRGVNLALVSLGAAYANRGNITAALPYYHRALEYYRAQHNSFALSSVLNDLACLYHLQGEYSLAFNTFEEALEISRQGGNARDEGLILTGLGDIFTDLDDPHAAQEAYHQARDIVEHVKDRFLIIYLDLAEAAVARLMGNFSLAHLKLNATKQLIEQEPSDYILGLYGLEAGKLEIARNAFEEAENLLSEAARWFGMGGQTIEEGRVNLLLAATAFNAGETECANTHLVEAFRLVSGLESQHILVSSARQAKTLLSAACSSPHIGRQSLRLLEQVTHFEDEIPRLKQQLRHRELTVPATPAKLRIRALGKAQVWLGEKPVTSADWQTQVTRDLFFLILSEPQGLTKEALGEILWPESTPAQLKLRFKNTIYRLRRALQQDVVLFNDNRYLFNKELDYECDWEQFLELSNRARGISNKDEQKEIYRVAFQLYQGEYLPEVDGGWVTIEREHLRQVFIEVGLRLVELFLEAAEGEYALDICRRLILEDPYLEEAYRAAMQAHAATGNRREISRLYLTLQKKLMDELDASPSSQTESLYQSLVD